MLETAWYFILAAVPLLWLIYRLKSAHVRKIASEFNGPSRSLPLLGDILQLTGIPPSCYGLFQGVQQYCKDYGSPVRAWFGQFFCIVLSDPDSTEITLASNKLIDKAFNYKFFVPWMGYGLLTSTGSKWRRRRKILTPTFHFKILEQFVEVFDRNVTILVECLRAQTGKPELNITHFTTLCTLDIICESAMGVRTDAQRGAESEYVKAVRSVADAVVVRSVSPWLFSDFMYRLSWTGLKERRALKVLHDTTLEVIRTRRKQLNAKVSDHEEEETDIGAKTRLAFLDMLLQYSQDADTLSDEDIREEVDTFMFEGHDTTTSAISFAIYCLAHHPDVQEKAVKEQQEMFGDSDRAVTYKDMQEMKYLELVIKETLRLFPSVPIIGREALEDFPIGNRVLPKGGSVFLNIFALHRNSTIFPEPTKFIPERFLPENTYGRHPYAYVPFSAGPRNCIGQKFAMLEMKATLSKMLRAFKILPVYGSVSFEEMPQCLSDELVLKSVKGVNIRLENRAKGT